MANVEDDLILELRLGKLDGASPDELTARARTTIERFTELRRVWVGGPGPTPPWLEGESKLWELGEQLRQLLLRRKSLAQCAELIALLRWVLTCEELGRGRQPFVELVARYDPDATAATFQPLLLDDGLRGQVIAAARRQKLAGLAKDVRSSVKDADPSWIKRAARRYLDWSSTVN